MGYLKEDIEKMDPYVPGEQPAEGGYLKLNTNENPFPPSPAVKKAIDDFAASGGLRLYPDPMGGELRKAVSELTGHAEQGIICGNGSDDILAIIIRACGKCDQRVVLTHPTYSLYRVLCQVYGLEYKEYDLALKDDFSLPRELCLARGSLLFLSQPNTPTGTLFPAEDIERLVAGFPGVVVLDEAYIDFAEKDSLALLPRHKNLIIVRTLSKGYSLASLRIGYALGEPGLIAGLYRVKDSYNLNALAIAVGAAALRDQEHMRRNRDAVIRERARLAGELSALGFTVYPSQANFLLVATPKAEDIYARLKGRRVLVRYFKVRRLEECLRITVGSGKDNDLLLQALKELKKEKAF